LLEPPRWQYQTEINGLPVFTDTSRGEPRHWLEPAGSASPFAPLLALAHATTPGRRTMAELGDGRLDSAPGRARPQRRAYEKGWVARLAPIRGGPSVTLRVRPLGAIQAIPIPRGRFTVTWVYTSKLAKLGVLASALCVLVLVLLCFTPRRRRRLDAPPGLPASGSAAPPGP